MLNVLLVFRTNTINIFNFKQWRKYLSLMSKPIYVLDGGLGSDLFINGGYERAKINNDPLWLARVTYENPDAIKECHKRFINAGSEVISTGSYQASIDGYVKYCNLSQEKARDVIGSSFDIAQAAIAECSPNHTVTIAGSISPYGAILHDMSEYSGTYIDTVSYQKLKEFHETNIEILASKGVKLFAFETLPALKEALALVDILHNYPECKAWVSFTTKTGLETSYGDPFVSVFRTFCNDPQVIAVGTNCCDPELTKPILQEAKGALGSHQSCIVYPDNRKCEDVIPKNWPWISELREWLATGLIGWVGGCCLTTPNHIKQIKAVVEETRKLTF